MAFMFVLKKERNENIYSNCIEYRMGHLNSHVELRHR